MYTQLQFASELKKDTPPEVIDILKKMVEDPRRMLSLNPPKDLPDHEFFKAESWNWLFTMDSYYFDADTSATLRFDDISNTYYLTVMSNIKNYKGEIQKFIDWIMPYLNKTDGDFLGYSRYEETEDPTIIKFVPPLATNSNK